MNGDLILKVRPTRDSVNHFVIEIVLISPALNLGKKKKTSVAPQPQESFETGCIQK